VFQKILKKSGFFRRDMKRLCSNAMMVVMSYKWRERKCLSKMSFFSSFRVVSSKMAFLEGILLACNFDRLI